jgi:hypothetical protein
VDREVDVASKQRLTQSGDEDTDPTEGRQEGGVPVALRHHLDQLDPSAGELSDLVGHARGLGPSQRAAAGAHGEGAGHARTC